MTDPIEPVTRRWKNVPLVREPDRIGALRSWIWFLGIALAFAPIAVYFANQSKHVQLSYRIEELRAERDRLEEAERRLLVERASLETLARVERQAKKLGLVRPQRSTVLARDEAAPAPAGLVAAATRAAR